MPLPATVRRKAETAIQGEAPQSMLRSEKVRLDPEPLFVFSCSPEAYELYRKWRLWLMETGMVPFPSEDWIQRYEDRLGERALRRATQAAAPEVKAERAAEAETQLKKARKARANVSEVADG